MARSAVDLLCAILWREREVLVHILDVVGDDGDDGDDAELALRSLGSLELHRAILTREVAVEHRIAGEPTLHEMMAELAPEWKAVLAGHRRALLDLAAQVDQALAGVRFPYRVDDGGANGEARASQARPAVQRSLIDFLA